jgi:hypothetical protein
MLGDQHALSVLSTPPMLEACVNQKLRLHNIELLEIALMVVLKRPTIPGGPILELSWCHYRLAEYRLNRGAAYLLPKPHRSRPCMFFGPAPPQGTIGSPVHGLAEVLRPSSAHVLRQS